MKAVLLAAGLGTRLAPLTNSLPKVLVPVRGEPLLGRQLRYLAANGVTDVAINVHHLAEMVEDYLARVTAPVDVRMYREDQIRGTAGALFPMRDFLAERFVVIYGDVVTDTDLRDLQRRARGVATLAYYVSSEVQDKGLLEVDAHGRIVSFVEKPIRYDRGCVNAGLYSLDPAIFDFIPPTGDFGFDVWPRLLAYGDVIYGYELHDYLLDMGSCAALTRLEDDIRRGVLKW